MPAAGPVVTMHNSWLAGVTKVEPEYGPLTSIRAGPAVAVSVPIAPVNAVGPVTQFAPVPYSNWMPVAVVAELPTVKVHSHKKICFPVVRATICVVVAVPPEMFMATFNGAVL